ncbi:electron transfer flavoprotein subunit beta/FixA family protein [Synergistes jonesii]|uniref:electron transfer flavoprotein subunit beta/FixA family protein n=1 Tax=Synergistes jonesii TaxID=2754 RepID=UPI00248E09B6|nr:electron transfer flavoprotein subunit beta/FixA family protein [Synergistes jonesii]
MKIAVLVKQVPAVDTVKIDEKTGTMIREGVEAELNPLDLHAVEAAVRIKEARQDASITAISMGPMTAQKAVRYAIAMGADDGLLLSDRKFGGADTLATARTLARAIKKAGPFDLLLAGERATDGETGQVGPACAELLGASVLSYVSAIEELSDEKVRVVRAVEGGHETVEAKLPAMVIPVKEMNVPRLCTLSGKLRAKKADVGILTADDISMAAEETGLTGSATQVVNVTYPKVTRCGRRIAAADGIDAAIGEIMKIFEDKNCLEKAEAV